MIKGKLRILDNDNMAFWCMGCDCYHSVNVNDLNGWAWNGDCDNPTFTPSILVRSGHYIPEHKGNCWCDYIKDHPEETNPYKCFVCHCFVTNGKIQYLSDCTHQYAGQTVDLILR